MHTATFWFLFPVMLMQIISRFPGEHPSPLLSLCLWLFFRRPTSPASLLTEQTIYVEKWSGDWLVKQPCPKWLSGVQSSSVQSLSHVRLFATPWTAACQASLSITNSRSSLKLMSIESVMPSSHLILCHPLLLLPSVFPSIRVFSSESALHIRWPKYWSFSFSISPSNEYSGLISFRGYWFWAGRYTE